MRALSVIFLSFVLLLLSNTILAAAVPAGRVIISMGLVSATDTAGAKRTLKRGDSIFSGETIETATNAKAQLRFTDETLVSLEQLSAFKVKNYQLSEQTQGKLDKYVQARNPAETQDGQLAVIQNTRDLKIAPTFAPNDHMIVALAKGGLRMVTGAIGHSNPSSYQIATTVGTIGVRGTYLGVKSYCKSSIKVQTLSDTSNLYINLPNYQTINLGSLSGFTDATISREANGNISAVVRVNPLSPAQVIHMNARGTVLSTSSSGSASSNMNSFTGNTPSATTNPANNPISQTTGQQAVNAGG